MSATSLYFSIKCINTIGQSIRFKSKNHLLYVISTLNSVNEKSFNLKNPFFNYYMTITSLFFNKMD